ncbi:MAG: 4-amino-4-deoxy-L-arabinose transferase-like glycosyltransferase, partial [Flammeovirgaceae bacterium]
YTGHYGYDDMEYAKAAVDLLDGEPDFSNHFAHRLSITAPTAVAFALVGVNDTGAALPALLFSFLIAILLAALLWQKGPIALAIGLSLAVLPQWFLFYTDKLMPDMAVAFFVFAAVAAYWFSITKPKKYTRGFAFAFSLSLLLGFLAKGTIVLALP